MHAVDIIAKKRDGRSLTVDEINFFIEGFTCGRIPDYQMAAWLMAVYLQGMDITEISALTLAMAQSGTQLDLSDVPGVKVDKHSTGGVADTTTLIVAPLIAAAGLKVAKLSGRGLGFTGGTIDKLEAIPGFRTNLSVAEFKAHLRQHGLALMGQTEDLAPADGKIYALRDVTGTIAAIPLIASSIMSKKIAAGADCIVLDVKVGSGAFMKDIVSARLLAETMVSLGKKAGHYTCALLTNMDEPLGEAVGNLLEVEEALAVLSGRGPQRLTQVCLELAAYMLRTTGRKEPLPALKKELAAILADGRALAKFYEFITAQGGRLPEQFPLAKHQLTVKSSCGGWLAAVDTQKIGQAAMVLGAGRECKGQPIDPLAGLIIRHRTGDCIGQGEPLAELHTNDSACLAEAQQLILEAVNISSEKTAPLPLILGSVE